MRTEIIKAALFTPAGRGRWGLPLLCWSAPGEAKSAIIEALGAEVGMPVVCLSPGTHGEGAFGCVPVPEDGLLTYPAPEWVGRFAKGGGAGVVFIDEVTTAPPALQPPLLGLVLERRVGFHYLGDRVRVLAAANPPELAACGYDLSPPVANRFGHIRWETPTVAEHTAYMLGEAAAPATTGTAAAREAQVLLRWPEAWARAVGLETAFLARRPNLKNNCPKPGDPQAGKAWCSDRTWEMATRALASAEVHGLGAVDAEVFVEAFIGSAVAGELFTFRDECDLPDPAALLDGKASWKADKRRPDKTHAVLCACTALVVPAAADKRADRTKALWQLLGTLTEDTAAHDALVPAMAALIAARLHTHREAIKPLAAIAPVLEAAGVRP